MIIDLYKTEIICKKDNIIKYSIKIEDNIDIIVRCTGYDNQPVISEEIKVYYDTNTLIGIDYTDNGGECHFTYQFLEYGIHTLTVNNTMIQINVEREMYPIGSVYMSFQNTNPSTLFGGEWERIQGKFLFAVEDNGGEKYNLPNKSGGSKDAVVVSHNHTQSTHNHSINQGGRNFLTAPSSSTWNEIQGANISGSGYHYIATSNKSNYDVMALGIQSATPYIAYNGVDKTDKNMPPYVTVYVWQRIG